MFLGDASADTYVGGGASGSWTSANNPYRLTSNVIIYSGSTLTIQAGTIVHLKGYQIQVQGTLNVQGQSSNKVYFLNDGNTNSQISFTSTSTGSGTLNYAVLYSVPIMIGGGAPTISNNYFTGGSSTTITINGGSPTISGNTINAGSLNCITLNGASASATITSNTLAGSNLNTNVGIYNLGGSITVVGNSITNCYTGIYSTGYGTIEQNTIIGNINDGIASRNVAHDIRNNALANNFVGVSGDGNIQNNAIINNQYGLWGTTSVSTVTNNNIYNYGENMHLTENYTDVTAINNWWGTAVREEIVPKISDSRVYFYLGTVTFEPYLTSSSSVPSVPSSISVPTEPPTPTVNPYTSPSPTPYDSSTPTPYPTATPTPYYSTPTPYPYQTYNPDPTPYPYYINTPTPTADPYFGGFTFGDITNVAVIIVAVALSISIIVIIHRKFSRSELPPPPDAQNY